MTLAGGLDLPRDALVLFVGAAGSGKSTWANAAFRPTQVLSSDFFRGVVADDEADQRASEDAFEVLELAVRKRLARGLLTVVDATNLESWARFRWIDLAARHGRPAVAVVIRVSLERALARNGARESRRVAADVVTRQVRELERALPGLPAEGFAAVHVIRG